MNPNSILCVLISADIDNLTSNIYELLRSTNLAVQGQANKFKVAVDHKAPNMHSPTPQAMAKKKIPHSLSLV